MEVKRHSVVLFYPTGGSNENCFTESLVGALAHDASNGNLIADVRCAEGLYIADNRDLGARRFMRYKLCATCRNVVDNGDKAKGARLYCEICKVENPETDVPEWLWCLDTDISFQTYDVLYQLLAYADPVERPVMSALYFGYMSNGNLTPIWYGKTPDGRIEHLKTFSSGLNELGVVGMGCCLIHRSVFEKLGTKYAKTGWLYFGHDTAPWVPEAAIDNDMTPFGEDNCFCHRCIEQGIPLYGVGSIVVEHRKKRYENMDTFLASFAKSEETAGAKGTALRLVRKPGETAARSALHRVEQPDNSGSPRVGAEGQSADGIVGLGETAAAVRGFGI